MVKIACVWTSKELQTKLQYIAVWLVLEYLCLLFPIQLSVGSVGLPPTDCSPRSAVKINAQASTEQVDPRWMHRGYKIPETDHRFCHAVSCHQQLKRYLLFSHVLTEHLMLLLQNCLNHLAMLIISSIIAYIKAFWLHVFHFRNPFVISILIY